MRGFPAEASDLGLEMHALARELFPIHRSIAGPGVRETLAVLARLVPLQVREVPTGTPVFDWVVPQEWHIRDAFIKDADGRRLVDYRESNLHVPSHSRGVRARMRWDELKSHLITLPEQPDWIPYRTHYFRDDWGFCLTHRRFLEMEWRGDAEYEVCIDAEFKNGALTYGELHVAGDLDEEVLFSSHLCHPSLANDNLSGIAVAAFLARRLFASKPRYSYRFLFLPATIGPITWLSLNEAQTAMIQGGLVLALLGDPASLTYKRSRRGDAKIDRAVAHVLEHAGQDHSIVDFEPSGYDERQYCSPGFDLPVGCLMRSPNGVYPEYHTSADDLNLIRPEQLADSWAKCMEVVRVLEGDRIYVNLSPWGEPRLGRWGLHDGYGSGREGEELQRAVQWVLNLADGKHGLLDVAERSGIEFGIVRRAADRLLECELLVEAGSDPGRVPVDEETDALARGRRSKVRVGRAG